MTRVEQYGYREAVTDTEVWPVTLNFNLICRDTFSFLQKTEFSQPLYFSAVNCT